MGYLELSPNPHRPTFTFPGAIIGALGAVFRKLKVGLFITCDGHRLVKGNTQAALFTLLPFYPFTFHNEDRLCHSPKPTSAARKTSFCKQMAICRITRVIKRQKMVANRYHVDFFQYFCR